eukprot:3590199-Pleurochrysis_carterae.AAC.1
MSCPHMTPRLACTAVCTSVHQSSADCQCSPPTRILLYPPEDLTAVRLAPKRTPRSCPTRTFSTGRPTLAV